MATKAKFTKTEVKTITKKIQEVVEKARRENKHELFRGLSEEDIARKLERVNSPMIVGLGWSPTTPGNDENVTINVFNPDPTAASDLYLHVWVGSGNVDPNNGTFLLNVDARFPRLSKPGPFGFTLAAGGNTSLAFALRVPATAERTVYMGTACLMRISYHDVGQYLDRACFPFVVA